MAKFKVKRKLIQTVIQLYWEEFDTEDQKHWESLKTRVDDNSSDGLDDAPDEAPNDPRIWFDLFQKMYYAEYREQDEDDWYSDRKGTTQHYFDLENSNGDLIESTEE